MVLAYTREEIIRCTDIPHRGFRVEGELKDDLHHLKVDMVIDFFRSEIMEAHAEAVNTPFPICKEAMGSIKKLVGVQIGPGFGKTVKQALINSEGCFHLEELIMSAVNAGLQASAREIPDWISREEYADRWRSWEKLYLGRCIHYAQPGAGNTLERVHTEILPQKKLDNSGNEPAR